MQCIASRKRREKTLENGKIDCNRLDILEREQIYFNPQSTILYIITWSYACKTQNPQVDDEKNKCVCLSIATPTFLLKMQCTLDDMFCPFVKRNENKTKQNINVTPENHTTSNGFFENTL